MHFVTLAVFNFFVIETLVFGYLLYLVYQGDCFVLIGNQRFLDTVIKSRLIYSIYFAQGKEGFIMRVDDDLGYSLGKGDISTAGNQRS